VLVYLGGDLVVDVREVVAVLDLRRRASSGARGGGRWDGEQEPARTQVVTTRGTYLTPLSPVAAARRLERGGERRRGGRRKRAPDAGLRR
jgi:hypothetical protein